MKALQNLAQVESLVLREWHRRRAASEGIGDGRASFGDAVKTADGTYDGRGFNGLGRSLSGRIGVVLV